MTPAAPIHRPAAFGQQRPRIVETIETIAEHCGNANPRYVRDEGGAVARILASAEAYGYGPSSKLRAVARELTLRGHRVDFVGQGVAAEYARAEGDVFASVRSVDSMLALGDISPRNYDATVSVMDPHLAAWSQLCDLPCIYVDSLYWFWQWNDDFTTVVADWESVRRTADVAGALAFFDRLPMMSAQYIAHLASDVTCAQRTPSTNSRADVFADMGTVVVVDGIVDTSYAAPREPTTWLACMSGLINPLTPVDAATSWLRSAAQLIDQAARQAGLADTPIVMTGNHTVLSQCALPSRFVSKPRNHADVLRAFNDAYACMTPPGLTTMLEAVSYGVPLLLLPEQHYGHQTIFGEFTAGDPAAFRNALLGTRVDRTAQENAASETIELIGELATRARSRDKVWEEMVADLATGISEINRDRTRVAAAQATAVRKFVTTFRGAQQVADVLGDVLEQAA